jgi:hypothetical protein
MGVERSLPENRAQYLERQAIAAENDVRRYDDALFHLRAALSRLQVNGPPEPGNARLLSPDDSTLAQISLAIKVVYADLTEAKLRSESAAAMLPP